jgi:hypothetical protein
MHPSLGQFFTHTLKMRTVCSSDIFVIYTPKNVHDAVPTGEIILNTVRRLVMPVSGSGGNRETAVGPPLNLAVEGFAKEMPNSFHYVEMR